MERNPLAFVTPSLLAASAHSSLGVYIGKRQGPAWLTTDEISPRVGGVDYLNFVLADHTSETDPVFQRLHTCVHQTLCRAS